MLTNGFWAWVGNPVPAGTTNDIGLFNSDYRNIKQEVLSKSGLDLFIGDLMFASLSSKIPFVVGWKREEEELKEEA